ncbi:hypothetical protein AQS8620_01675 [Aquimixticola soesokkakensis]|uniref:Fe-S protein n=1 Tax=Aquimixticola soesokkakensis TaxID=1519096 RepID=A0A1Y5SM53_9RHOB|nr:DUF1289 domain-containing protein [Aquimixticola soesokkakensis]SLN42217.1 hypothetical protein AQS8620_01675 [Aquimixticola soesokkakensis]
MTDPWRRDEIESPCTNICQMHPVTGFCIGCQRSLDEIASWSSLTPQARAQVMAALSERRAAQKNLRRGGRARTRQGKADF